MASSDRARLTAREGRRFAWTLALAFGAFAALAFYRGRPAWYGVFGSASVIALAAGAFAPTRLGPARSAWMALAHRLSLFTSPVLFGAFFYLILFPVGVIRRRLGRSPLARDRAAESYWAPRRSATPAKARASMERLF